MELKKNLDGNKLTVEVIGRLDAVTAIQFDKEIAKSLDGIEFLTIDLINLNYIASAGLRILMKLQKRMNVQGSMKIININSDIRSILDMTGFSRLLTIEDADNSKKLSTNF